VSVRRQARVKASAAFSVDGDGSVPRCLLVGRLVEAWGLPELHPDPRTVAALMAAKSRFRTVRLWWLDQQGISYHDGWSVLPSGAPWSASALIAAGQEAQVRARLAPAGCTLADLDDLTTEARGMYDTAYKRAAAEVRRYRQDHWANDQRPSPKPRRAETRRGNQRNGD
jgi:hypothetical protein